MTTHKDSTASPSGADKAVGGDLHTPGPWEAVLVDDPRGQPVPYYRGLICTVEHGDRYLSVVTADDSGTTREQWPHNCRLIAAAPDLLEALRATQFGFMLRRCPVCAGWNMSDNGETDHVHTPDCIVGKAIAKATGAQ